MGAKRVGLLHATFPVLLHGLLVASTNNLQGLCPLSRSLPAHLLSWPRSFEYLDAHLTEYGWRQVEPVARLVPPVSWQAAGMP